MNLISGALAIGAALLVAGCAGDDDAIADGGPPSDARLPPGVDGGGPVDGDARRDAGPAMPPASWAPQAWEDCEGGGRTLEAGPTDYRDVLDGIAPGDTLRLRPGDYARGLPIRVSGQPDRCIVIEGMPGMAAPRLLGSDSFNVISLRAVAWVKVRGLDLDGMGLAGDGVKSEGGEAGASHHIVIEGLHMQGFAGSQQTVGISTKTPAWDWVIRGNTIVSAGTGMYLGNSDGTQPFVRGVVELNTVVDTIGYNVQIKHQISRPSVADLPTEPSDTLVRWNVFSKQFAGSSGGDARPNFLLGHFPTSGPGATDRYLVYGNFFHDNPNENLVQAEGNVAFWANVLVNRSGGAAVFQPHNDVPRDVDVFLNTVIAAGRAIRISGGDPGFTQQVRWNAVYADQGISAATSTGNVEGRLADAARVFVNATAAPGGGLDLHPSGDALDGAVDLGALSGYPNAALDFDGRTRDGTVVGAYAGPAGGAAVPLDRQARPYAP